MAVLAVAPTSGVVPDDPIDVSGEDEVEDRAGNGSERAVEVVEAITTAEFRFRISNHGFKDEDKTHIQKQHSSHPEINSE